MNETDPRKLESYLERVEAYDGGLAPEVERLVEALRDWPHKAQLQPRAGFVDEAAEQLHHHAGRSRTVSTWPNRILAGALGAVALVVFGLIVIGLFSRGGDDLPAAGPETPISAAATPAVEEDVIPTETAEPTATTPPTATSTPASVAVEEWPVYENDFLGYRFSYPPEARIRTLGITGFPTDELPENRTAEEYRAQLEEVYPDDLCVSVQYQTGFVTFVPSADVGGRYTGPCGVTGVGDYDVTDVVETVLIDDIACTVTGWQMRERGESAAWHGEFYFLQANDSTTIHYGSMSGTQEQFLDAREALLQIVASFRSEQGVGCDTAGATGSSAPPDITLTLQDVSTTRYETKVSLQIEIAGDHAGSVTVASLAYPTLVDDQGNEYTPGVSSATTQTTADGLLVELTQSFRPGALDAQSLFLETGVELQAVASSPVTLDLRGRQPGDRWPVDQTVELYGLMVPLVEAALVADPEGLSLQLAASCVSGDGAQLIQLQLLAEGETHPGDGYSRGCDGGRLVSARTLQGLLGDGSASGEMESVTLQPAGRLHLPGPWALRWEAGE